tara:strand:- start:86077 stop:86346 length:270 start_codon:yes stop_codon:yes gene_type:complete
LGVREVNLVVRHLKLEGVNETNRDAIDHTFGIDSVQCDNKTATLHLAYDATHCQLDGQEGMFVTMQHMSLGHATKYRLGQDVKVKAHKR